MICAFTSLFSCSWLTALTLPAVPTGMNIGVSTSPWSVVNLPARAFECGSLLSRVNVNCIGRKVLENGEKRSRNCRLPFVVSRFVSSRSYGKEWKKRDRHERHPEYWV